MHELGQWRPRRLFLMHAIFAFAIVSWFIPITRDLWIWAETQVFYTLNGTLFHSVHAQAFWATVNHKYEGKIMPWFIASLQVTAIAFLPKGSRRHVAAQILFFWLAMEILIPVGNIIAQKLLYIRRASPSLVLEPVMRLSILFREPLIRDQSTLSFYSGHSFVNTYYAYVAIFCLPRFYKFLFVGICLFMNMPRLFVGGHWVSDCIFAALVACYWMTWMTATPLHAYGTRFTRAILDALLGTYDRLRGKRPVPASQPL